MRLASLRDSETEKYEGPGPLDQALCTSTDEKTWDPCVLRHTRF